MQKISRIKFTYIGTIRAVGRSENSGLPILFGGHNLPPLVEIGLLNCQNLGVPGHGTIGTPRDETPEYYILHTFFSN